MAINVVEKKVKKILMKQGYKVLRNGWPDFLAIKNKEVKAIEVKRDSLKPSKEQARMHKYLQMAGLKVEVINLEETKTAKISVDLLAEVHRIAQKKGRTIQTQLQMIIEAGIKLEP